MKYKKILILGISLLLTSCNFVIAPSNNNSSNNTEENSNSESINSSENEVTSEQTSNVVVQNCSTVTVKSEIGQSIIVTNKWDTYLEKSGIITSFGGSNVYGGGSISIRLGSSSSDGSLKINIQNAKVKAVEIEGECWTNDGTANTIVRLSSGKEESFTWTEKQDTNHTYTFNDTSTSNYVEIKTDGPSKNRLLIKTIRIYAENSNEPVNPNTSSNSSTNSTSNSSSTKSSSTKPSSVSTSSTSSVVTTTDEQTILSYESDFTLTKGNLVTTKESYDGYYKAPLSTSFNMKAIDDAGDDQHLNYTGTAKILVVPVDFTDYKSTKLGDEEDTQREIYKAFFGESSDTGWESVKTYYEKSSYGALTFEGSVLPWYHSTYTTKTFAKLSGSGEYKDYYDPTWSMLEKVYAYAKSLGVDLKDYDNDKDGLIDGIWMVYACKDGYLSETYDPNGTFWAYTYADYNTYDNKSTSNPQPFRYCWGSYNFLSEGGYGKVDAHTMIHETGHMLGLDDYYDVEGNEGVCGGVDMMDNNIGDHSAYSKMLMDWTSPYVVDGTKDTTTITLKPFESSGDFILLKDSSWNGSALDEYVLIEYYTPTGLNEKDKNGYASGLNTYTQAGIKIWHIDSRVIQYEADDYGNATNIKYVDKIGDSSKYYYGIGASNSKSYSMDPTHSSKSSYRKIALIQSSGNNTFASTSFETNYGKNSVLFHEGDTFSLSKYNKFFTNAKMNDSTTFSYVVSIGELTSTGVTITITK